MAECIAQSLARNAEYLYVQTWAQFVCRALDYNSEFHWIVSVRARRTQLFAERLDLFFQRFGGSCGRS
jgi:hypothetical protein